MNPVRVRRDAATRGSFGPGKPGVTLVELLVVIVLLGLMAGLAGLAAARWPVTKGVEQRAEQIASQLAAARRAALRSGRSVSITVDDSAGVGSATALPDGSVVSDSLLGTVVPWDRLTGKPTTPQPVGKDGIRASP
jgi:general secretion pathway protein H